MEESKLPAKKRTRLKALQSCVYFNEDEFKKISDDASATGKSIPILLKAAYFPSRRVRVLMHKDDEEKWFSELRRWGVNLNQIAKKVNSGIMAGWYEEFKFVSTALLNIEKLVVGAYGSNHF